MCPPMGSLLIRSIFENESSRVKVGALGFLITLSFILCTVATFTKRWIRWDGLYAADLHSGGVGIVPYGPGEAGWFAAASGMMFMAFGLHFLLFVVYLHAAYKVHHHGFCHSIRPIFIGITLLCLLIGLLQAIAFILMVTNASDYNYYGTIVSSSTLGYSAYLSMVSAPCAGLAMMLSELFARFDCRKNGEEIDNL